MNKRGRPLMPPELKSRREIRVILYTDREDLQGMRQLAAYYGVTIQELTRRWWKLALSRAAADQKIDFHRAAKNN